MIVESENNEGGILVGYSPPLLRPRSTARWLLFVLLNILLYAAACGFWQTLSADAGRPFWESSLQENMLFEIKQITPAPGSLSIFNNPWMIPVTGCLLGLLIFVPIAMSVLYQLVLALGFVMILAVVGMSPELAVILVVGCLLSSRTRMRRKYPFYAMLFGLLPVTVYLALVLLMTRSRNEMLLVHQWIMVVPFITAITLAVGSIALTVLMARLTRFRPGTIWPAALVLLASSAGLFFNKVGRDEMEYAQISGLIEVENSPFDPLHGGYIRNNEKAEAEYLERREILDRQCEDFFESHPESARAPSVLLIRSFVRSVQLDKRDKSGWMTRYSSDWPMESSRMVLRQLIREYPKSSQAALARYRLGILTMRKAFGLVEEDNREGVVYKRVCDMAVIRRACEMLKEAEARLQEVVDDWKAEDKESVFSPLPSAPRNQWHYAEALFEARRLNWLIRENDVANNKLAATAFAELLSLNPYRPDYVTRLETIRNLKQYEKSPLRNNLRVAWAKEQDVAARFGALSALASAETEDADAAIEANYELGVMAGEPEISELLGGKGAKDFFEKVRAASENPWQSRVEEYFSRQEASAPTPDDVKPGK